ncbi:MAG: ATP-binding cassette domain-containing protein, partial [Anaerolineaceae bacterium]
GDRCTVLRDGGYIGTVILKEVEDCDLVKMMVGRNVELNKRENHFITDEEIIRVEGLSCSRGVKEANFSLRKGEILGVAGLVGSGRTELAKCIIGEYKSSAGSIFVKGKKAKINNPC